MEWFSCFRGIFGGKSPASLEELHLSLRSLCEIRSKSGGSSIGFLFKLPGSRQAYVMTSRLAISNTIAARDAVAHFQNTDLSLDPDVYFVSSEYANADLGKEIRFEATIVGVSDPRVSLCYPLELGTTTARELYDHSVAHLQYSRESGRKGVVLGTVHSLQGSVVADDSDVVRGQAICPVLDIAGDLVGVQTSQSNVVVLLKPFFDSLGLTTGPPGRRTLPYSKPVAAATPAFVAPVTSSQRSAGLSTSGYPDSYSGMQGYGSDRVLPSSTASYSAANSPAVTPSRGLPKGTTEDTIVFIKESRRTPGLRTFHFRPDCGGQEKEGSCTVRLARTKGCRQCERCTPRQGGTGLEELRAFKALFGSKNANKHANFAGSRSVPTYDRIHG